MNAVIRSAGVTSKAGFQTPTSAGADWTPRNRRTSSAVALLDDDVGAGRRVGVEAGARSGDVERDAVAVGEHGQLVRADLVGGVAVRGDAVAADDHGLDHAPRHREAGGAVGDQADVDAGAASAPTP